MQSAIKADLRETDTFSGEVTVKIVCLASEGDLHFKRNVLLSEFGPIS